jgi:ubiquinone/menaquinone biosynthesis C-methylase UbiE
MDISEVSLKLSRKMAIEQRLNNLSFRQGDIYALPYRENSFDHVFICFVLEHLADVKKHWPSSKGY